MISKDSRYNHGRGYGGREEFEENAFIPLPGFEGIVKRKVKQKKGKKELNGYQLHNDVEKPNFGLIYNFLPDVFDITIGKSWEGNKFNWLDLISHYSPSTDEVPEIPLPDNHFSIRITATTAQPLIVGLGEPSPYETGITLDFLTGLPIIPGSALKGIARRAAIMILSENTDVLPYGEEFEELAKEYDQDERVVEIFGTQDRKGKVIFMDAYPVEWPNGLFKVDIMNPHYGPYYESKGKEPPADWYNPIPVPYLTVNIGVTYRFVLASRDSGLLETARKWLKFALENIGVGAKGNQGYGVFEVDAN